MNTSEIPPFDWLTIETDDETGYICIWQNPGRCDMPLTIEIPPQYLDYTIAILQNIRNQIAGEKKSEGGQ
jgi:hypothetical protein